MTTASTAVTTTTTSSSNGTGGAGGGGSGSGGSSEPTVGDYPCAVYDVLVRNCAGCHAADTYNTVGAPFPFMTWEDGQLPISAGSTTLRYMQMAIAIVPGSSLPQMPLGGTLSAADSAILEPYLTGSAPDTPVPEGMAQNCTQQCNGAPCVPQ